ncbi:MULTISPECIES: RICIN domain-containing protein [Niastella]|uniref:RICIN domain-containing protein n=1 Tax=Niastella soli TaxID=2821487 RepID=A0ABS3YUR7_9BACT|nr:RICIN domain-containing protein [Niastella soli]MBO9201618.1 RICIN domain-containing protein [Niastella soli]
MQQLYCQIKRLPKHWQTTLLLLFVLCTNFSLPAFTQAKLTATGSSGSGYPVITAAGFAYEDPDCVHSSFGPHVTQAFDADLNKNVFVFHSHIVDDNDRCTNFDRVRMEIKGNNSTTQHTEGQTAWYRWKFKLDANFIGGSSFCHIFQIKAYTGDAGAPLITITPRASVLEVIHDGGDEAGSVDLGKLISVDLAPFKGTWVEGYVKYTSSDNGSFEITLKRVSDGATLLSYSKTSGIDLWRTGGGHNRPKWGVYRSKNSTGLRDEQVRFADFCVSESSESQCPSEAGSGGGGGTFSGYYRLTPRHSGKALVVQNAATSNSAAVIQYTYGGSSTNDEWQLQSIGSGYYRIINRNSSKDMVVQSASTSDGAAIIQYTYGGSNTNDEWQLVDNGGGYYRIVNRMSGKVVEVAGSSTVDGAAVQQNTWNGGTNQQFELESLAAARQKTMNTAITEPTLNEASLRFQNPIAGSTVISLTLPESGLTNVTIFDQTGRAVKVLVNSPLNKGSHSITLNQQAIAAGTYFIRLVQNDKKITRQLIKQ